MLYFNLAPIFRVRGITRPIPFLMKAGIGRRAASHMVNDTGLRPDLRNLSALCLALNCSPNEVLAWKPDAATPLPAGHPLQALIPTDTPFATLEKIKGLPLSKIAEIEALLATSGAGN